MRWLLLGQGTRTSALALSGSDVGMALSMRLLSCHHLGRMSSRWQPNIMSYQILSQLGGFMQGQTGFGQVMAPTFIQ